MSRLLEIYLNDHLAGSTAGVEVARRVRGSNEGDPQFGPELTSLCAEIEADRELLLEVMERLGVSPGRVKPAAAWAGEKLGRLKLNGQVHGYSPLSRLVELELLSIGVGGKICLWRALEVSVGDAAGIDFAAVQERADGQRDRIEALHSQAARIAFAEEPTAAAAQEA
jgi:hypothetical protein